MTNTRSVFWIHMMSVISLLPATVLAEDTLRILERQAERDPKPYVILEASQEGTTSRGQGVVITPLGHVLSAGHISWIDDNKKYSDTFRISFRGGSEGLPAGFVHTHKAVFSDREDTEFFEYYYNAELQKHNGSRFIGEGDLALFRIKAEGVFPKVEFFSKSKPKVKTGDVLHLCHYTFPHKAADPTFLINPVEVVGVAQTPHGLQYLARGYYRWGSSGGALLKGGRLIGIQSAAYTVNAKDIGEMPMGLISFQLVWSKLFEDLLKDPPEKTPSETE
ncbi:MAG: hypothetical protein QGI24_05730 [Kiritimatiellia bacterium]|jgi:hypothetical protein|nr:hypothetical protein [Kiritimatiellia bacterium]MDP6848269.1 hypothetical protein [Kiritimatiellia bacterium]